MNTTIQRFLFGLLAAIGVANAQPPCIQGDYEMTVGSPAGALSGHLSSYGTTYYSPPCNQFFYTVDVLVPGPAKLPPLIYIGGEFDQPSQLNNLTCGSASITVGILKRSKTTNTPWSNWKFVTVQNANGTWNPIGGYCHLTDAIPIPTPGVNETDQYRLMVLPELSGVPAPGEVYWYFDVPR